MALFGLGISAAVKGVSGLFRGARTAIRRFRNRRKAQTAEFREELMQSAGSFSLGLQDNATPSNPIGVTSMPTAEPREVLDGGRIGNVGRNARKPLFKIGSFEITPMIALLGAIGIGGLVYMLKGKKRKW
jgi:hypothetical protein